MFLIARTRMSMLACAAFVATLFALPSHAGLSAENWDTLSTDVTAASERVGQAKIDVLEILKEQVSSARGGWEEANTIMLVVVPSGYELSESSHFLSFYSMLSSECRSESIAQFLYLVLGHSLKRTEAQAAEVVKVIAHSDSPGIAAALQRLVEELRGGKALLETALEDGD